MTTAITTILNDPLDKQFQLTGSFESLHPMIDNYLKDRAKTYKEKGFRLGKVPYDRIKELFYAQALEKALYAFVQEESRKLIIGQCTDIFSDAQRVIKSHYNLKHADAEKGIEWTLVVQLKPEMPEIKWSDCIISVYDVKLSDEDIDLCLNKWAASSTTSKPLDPSPEKADYGHTVWVESKERGMVKVPLTQENQDQPWVKQLHGVSIGFSWDQTLSKAQHGVKKRLHWVVKDIQETVPCDKQSLPESLGVKDHEALVDSAKRSLENEIREILDTLKQKQLLDFLASYEFDVPSALIDEEFKGLWENLKGQLSDGQTVADFTEMSEEEAKILYHNVAQRRVRVGFIVSECAKKWNIAVDQQDWRKFLEEECMRYPGQEEQVLQYYRSQESVRYRSQARILESKVFQHIYTSISEVQIVHESCDFDTLKRKFDQSVESSEKGLLSQKGDEQ